MKRIISVLLCLSVLALCACGRAEEPSDIVLSAPETIPQSTVSVENRKIRVVVTELLADSELMYKLKEKFESRSNYRLDLVVNSNSTAVSVAQTGNADVLLLKSDTSVNQLVSAGYGKQALPFISDSFVLVGPKDDPAFVRDAETVSQAFIRIAQSGSMFVSRYDDSDTYKAEQKMWSDADITIGNGRSWYRAARLEMSGTLNLCNELQGYVLAEREAFLSMQDTLNLEILQEDIPGLKTHYCIVPMNETTFDSVNVEGVNAFIDFLLDRETSDLISSFGTDKYNCPIFYMDNKLED